MPQLAGISARSPTKLKLTLSTNELPGVGVSAATDGCGADVLARLLHRGLLLLCNKGGRVVGITVR